MSTFTRWLATLLGQSEFEVKRLLDDPAALHFLLTWSLFESKCFGGFLKGKDLHPFAERVVRDQFSLTVITPIALHFHQRFQDKKKAANLLHDDKTSAESRWKV